MLEKITRIHDSDIMNALWFKGYIDILLDEQSEPFITFTEKSEGWMESEELSDDEKSMMYDIIYYSEYTKRNEGE